MTKLYNEISLNNKRSKRIKGEQRKGKKSRAFPCEIASFGDDPFGERRDAAALGEQIVYYGEEGAHARIMLYIINNLVTP